MKTLVLFAALLSLTTALADGNVVRLSEPVAETDSYEDFGAEIDNGAETLSLRAVVDDAETYANKTVVIKTRVSKVCRKKGCFFIAQDGDSLVRVAFKDYGFFVPTDISGKTVTLSGKLVKREVSAEEAAHFSEDAPGADLPAGTVYEIIADAVRVPKSTSDG